MNLRILTVLLLGAGFVNGCNKPDDSAGKPGPAPAAPAATTQADPPAVAAPTSWPATTQPGHILAGDLLAIEVADLSGAGSETVLPKQVAADGTVSLAYLSKPLKLAGMTDAEAEQEISKSYHDENIINKAAVGVRRLRIAGTGGPAPAPIAPNDLLRIAVGDLTDLAP